MLGDRMEREIREQPEVLYRGARTYRDVLDPYLKHRQFDMILLAARGSSDNAALFARYLIEVYLGIPVSLAAPSVFTRYGGHVRYRNCLAIGISQSGAAPDVSEVVASLRAAGHATLAITNTPDSRLGREAEATLLLEAGPETSVAATKTYSASLLACYEVVRALGAHLAPPETYLPDDRWVDRSFDLAAEVSGLIVRSQPIFALGRGYSFSTAQESALKLMECALIPCKSYSVADFEHGPKALAGPGSAAVSYGGRLKGIEEQGCQVVVCPEPPLKEELEPLTTMWDIVFAQALALHAARARGLNPDDPRHLSKVTQTL